jgi:hypothetical protein
MHQGHPLFAHWIGTRGCGTIRVLQIKHTGAKAMQHLTSRAAAALLSLAAASPALAAGWNETVNGDLSNDGLAPTAVTLAVGTSTVQGSTGRAVTGGPVDRDYFSIVVPAGFVLDAMILQDGISVVGGGSFLGLMAGPLFTVPPTTSTAAGLLGWTVYNDGNIGSDMLSAMSIAALGSSGFDTPLPAGAYSFWVQETGVGVASYSFGFSVSAVPELPPALGLLSGLVLLAALRRR